MTIEEVKQIIFNSKFDAGSKQRLVLLLPRLGKYTLNGLGKEVSRGDSVTIADYLVSLWEQFANLLDGLKNKDASFNENLSKFLAKNLYKFNGEDELYILNFVLDARALANIGQTKLTAQQDSQLLDFEVSLYWQLPKEEILSLLRNELLYLLQKINLLKDNQVVVYMNSWDYDNDFNKIFPDCLYQNNEVFAANSKKTVGGWIKDFFDFAAPTNSQTNTFGVAEFLLKDPSVQKLSSAEKTGLSEILKLFIWLLKPDLDEKEVLDYKEKKENEKNKQYEQELGLPDEVVASKPQPPVTPTPKNAPVLKPIEEIRSRLATFAPAQARPTPPLQNPLPKQQVAAPVQNNPLSKQVAPSVSIPNKVQPGLSMGLSNDYQPVKSSNLGQKTQAEIDKKLQELEKRVGENK